VGQAINPACEPAISRLRRAFSRAAPSHKINNLRRHFRELDLTLHVVTFPDGRSDFFSQYRGA
jgi:hypothetical protein